MPMMYLRDMDNFNPQRVEPLAERGRNWRPREVRELTDAERRALCKEAEQLCAHVHRIMVLLADVPITSETLERIDTELRTNDDGTVLPPGTPRHPASDEFEEIEAAFDDVFTPLMSFYEDKSMLDELLVTLRSKVQPWLPKR